ncbi:MAG TPA: AraC family transcriptional regulator [Spongiibacteraceae bacterium]|nr:AraC family transcriptional regulator [Spongiibacteraceae bacterium]
MIESAQEWIEVEAQVSTLFATAQIVELQNTQPCDIQVMDRDVYWLDMCLTPRPGNTRLCYRNHWAQQRFERIGKVFLLPPAEEVLLRSDGGAKQRSIFCHLDLESLRSWLDCDLRWEGRRLEASLDIADSRVKNLLVRLVEEMQQPGFASKVLVELLTGQLAIELSRYFIDLDHAPAASELAAWRLHLIDERLREETKLPTLSELAVLCNLSIRQLTRGFRASRGCSIGEYIAQDRVERAKHMLDSEQSVKTIGYQLGFASPSGFCSAFRRATGMTPGEFRAALARRH